MIKSIQLVSAGLLVGALWVTDVPVAYGDPLTPLTPGEVQYLDTTRRLLPSTGDPVASNGDGVLLDMGRYVCHQRDVKGLVGQEQTLVPALLAQLAFVYLCP